MIKNKATSISFQANSSADGLPVTTGTPTVEVEINDDGNASPTAATATHTGNGKWTVALAAGETNGDHVSYTFTLAGAITQTVNTYPVVPADYQGALETYHFYVDPESGSDTNPGTAAEPFATIRHASENGISGNVNANVVMTISVTPSTLADLDHIRFDSGWDGGTCHLKSTIAGVPFRSDNVNEFIYAIGDCHATVTVDDCDVTCGQIAAQAAAVTDKTFHLTLKGGCKFTHDDPTVSEVALQPFTVGQTHSLTIEPGCELIGWCGLVDVQIGTIDIDGMIFTGLDNTSSKGCLVSAIDSLKFRNTQIRLPNAANNVWQFRIEDGRSEIANIDVEIRSTNTSSGFQFLPPLPGTTASGFSIKDSRIAYSGPGSIIIGAAPDSSKTRAVQDAEWGDLGTLQFTRNTFTQDDATGGILRMGVGADNCILDDNIFIKASDSTNVHNIYLYSASAVLTNNIVIGSVLCFGPDQIITGNTILTPGTGDAILLGGDQGGTQPVGGGNNYTISNNILASEIATALNDYSLSGSYPTNLGELVADIDNNAYVDISGNGVLLDSTNITTVEDLQSKWQTWGTGNENNSMYDSFMIDAVTKAVEKAIASKQILTPADALAIREIVLLQNSHLATQLELDDVPKKGAQTWAMTGGDTREVTVSQP